MTGGMQTICKIIYIFLAFVAIVLIGVGIFVGVARAESAVLPFTSAEDLRARVDSVLKANIQTKENIKNIVMIFENLKMKLLIHYVPMIGRNLVEIFINVAGVKLEES